MEKPLRLGYPVRSLDGRELLPAGTCLTSATMAELARSAPAGSLTTSRLLEYGTIAGDLRRFCEAPPYNQIFSNPRRNKDLFAVMQGVELNPPLLSIYDHFKTVDPYTYRHVLLVFALSLLLAQDLIKDPEELAREVAAAPTHDFGKVCVPKAILRKSTPLNEAERRLLGHHAAAGYVLLSYYLGDPNHPAAITARDHHERRDGSGYPRGIKLQNRLVEIVAVVDIFDALVSPRPYRPHSYDVRTALEEITGMADTKAVHEEVVRALISCNRKEQPPYRSCVPSREKRGTPPPDNVYRGVTSRPPSERPPENALEPEPEPEIDEPVATKD